MIAIENLQFRYPRSDFHLQVAELTVERGSKVALIGPSGIGKTTLLNLIAGISVPETGRIAVGGVDISTLGDAARRNHRIRQIGLVFQEFELVDHLSVLDNILLAYRISPALSIDRTVRERAVQLGREVGIEDKLRRYVRRLSQGERQRVAICRALLTEPPLLLCDEPTGNLDPANKEHILDILDRICPEIDDPVVSFAIGDDPFLIVLLLILNIIHRAPHDLRLLRWCDDVVNPDGEPGPG